MIEISHISKKFDDKMILNDFSLHVEDGSFTVIAGKSGCGKTTLLNIIGGLEKPDKGSVLVNGVDIHKKRNMGHYFTYEVGFLFQNFALLEEKTVLQNMNLVQKKARTESDALDILKRVGLENKKNTEVYKLSGGEQQRVALSRLMYKKCNIILADEPTGSLDAENTDIVMKILHEINQQGKTIILVTHNEKIISKENNVIYL